MFDPGGSRSSPCLPVFGIVARVALWEGLCQGWMRLQRFLEDRCKGLKSLQEGGTGELFTPYV